MRHMFRNVFQKCIVKRASLLNRAPMLLTVPQSMPVRHNIIRNLIEQIQIGQAINKHNNINMVG